MGITFSPRQQLAISLLASGQSQRATADAVGAHANTVHLWGKIPEFREEISRQQQTLLSELRARLLNSTGAALSALVDLCEQKDDPPTRLGAAKAILNNSRLIPCGTSLGVESAFGRTIPQGTLPELATEALRDLEGYLAGRGPQDFAFTSFLSESDALTPEYIDRLQTDEQFFGGMLRQFEAWCRIDCEEDDLGEEE